MAMDVLSTLRIKVGERGLVVVGARGPWDGGMRLTRLHIDELIVQHGSTLSNGRVHLGADNVIFCALKTHVGTRVEHLEMAAGYVAQCLRGNRSETSCFAAGSNGESFRADDGCGASGVGRCAACAFDEGRCAAQAFESGRYGALL
eukprot:7382881-Prymnesium_polylepis.2